MKRKYAMVPAIALLVLSLLAGCGNGGGTAASEEPAGQGAKAGENGQTPPISTEPVTLKIALSMGWLGPDEFQKYFEDPVKKRYPNISFETYDMSKPELSLDKLVAGGTIPDIVMSASAIIFRYTGMGLESDITPLVKKHQFDLSRINPIALDAVKTAAGTNELTGLPWTRHISALYYNKDIFDKFGVAYPTDGMTWEDVTEMARKLTRKEGDVQYRGLEPDQPGGVASVLELPAVDAASKKATLDNDGWKRVFDLLKSIYDIPGNNVPKFANGAWDEFVKDRTLAMYPTNNRLPNLKDVEGLNWDIAEYPSFKDKPNVAPVVDLWILHITEQSKHKDEAFQVLSAILSDEVQTEMARNARVPVVENDTVRQEFGKNLPYLQGKHLEAVFKSQPAKAILVSKYDSFAGSILQNSIVQVANGQKDVNTALRDAEEEYNQKIASNP